MLVALVWLLGLLAAPASAIAGMCQAAPGLVSRISVLAGVDGAALQAFFKPSLGAAPALPAVGFQRHCRRAGEGS